MAKTKEVTHSPKFDKVKSYYDTGYWKIKRVRKAVEDTWITADEFQEITKKPYES